ncbi:hypothetical protein D3C76_1117880 [compost metagenome]
MIIYKPNRPIFREEFPAMNELVNSPVFPFKPKGFQSLGHRDKMRVVGWQSAIRGLVTTYYAYVEGASAN